MGCSQASTTAAARSAAPAPPRAKPSLASAANAPASSAACLTNATSSSVSPGRRLTATTAGIPNSLDDPQMAAHVGHAGLRAASGAVPSPPWCLTARTVVTSTTAFGRRLPKRQTMSKNFSIPMSDPNPDSVTT